MNKLTTILKLVTKTHQSDKIPDESIALPQERFTLDRLHLEAFNNVVGWQHNQVLAPTYLQVVAFPMYLEMMANDAFPFKPLGVVHVQNQITQLKPLPVGEEYELSCSMQDFENHNRGHKFSICTEARANGELVYSAKASNLVVTQPKASKKPSEPKQNPEPSGKHWNLEADIGRRYATVSGDYNPIHLFPISAKLFGFPAAIAHGMYCKARCLSEVFADKTMESGFTAEVKFFSPVLLPTDIWFQNKEESAEGLNSSFSLRSKDKLHLKGSIKQDTN